MGLEVYIFRMLASLVLGAIIGFERHWHHKMAGLRTNILVSVGSTMFILLSIEITGDTSPSRIASQIVTGIGFLGAGVIMKEGITIRGLNTAATLWCSAAVGSLCGIGSWEIAFAGTLFVIVTHLILRPLENYLNDLSFKRSSKPYSKQEYYLKVITTHSNEQHVRHALLNILVSPEIKILSISCTNDSSGELTEILIHVLSFGKLEDKIQKFTSLLNADPAIKSVSWELQGGSVGSEF